MSQTVHDLEVCPYTQTLPPDADVNEDDSRRREPLEHIDHLRLILPIPSVVPQASIAVEDAYVNKHGRHAARDDVCKQSRRLKIGCTGTGWPRPDVPYLRMSGRWLERAGFAIGQMVKIDVVDRRLVIEPVD
jgi:toxic protein SymE